MTNQPAVRLHQMVASMSRRHIHQQSSTKKKDQREETGSIKRLEPSQSKTSERKDDMVRRNKEQLGKHLFLKDRQKRYCVESGLPTKEDFDEQRRLDFLKDVEKNMKYMKLTEE